MPFYLKAGGVAGQSRVAVPFYLKAGGSVGQRWVAVPFYLKAGGGASQRRVAMHKVPAGVVDGAGHVHQQLIHCRLRLSQQLIRFLKQLTG